MFRRRCEKKRIPAERSVLQAAQVRFERHDGRVNRSVFHLLDETNGSIFRPLDRELRIVSRERRSYVREDVGADGRDDSEAKRSAQRIRLLPRELSQIAGGCQNPARLRDERRDCGGGANAVSASLKQLHAERALGDGDLRAERRLRDVTHLRRAAEAAVLGYCDDVLELPQGDRQWLEYVHS
jgi:hypothetical protein